MKNIFPDFEFSHSLSSFDFSKYLLLKGIESLRNNSQHCLLSQIQLTSFRIRARSLLLLFHCNKFDIDTDIKVGKGIDWKPIASIISDEWFKELIYLNALEISR